MTDGSNDDFCKVLVKKSSNVEKHEDDEEPLIDVIDEGENIRLLVQGKCSEQQYSIHINEDKSGITICREACHIQKGSEKVECNDFCSRNIPLNIEELQLEGMLFVVSQCKNNVLEIVIPKTKKA
jgi:HSP20 family molecular chaperone IbpA